MQFNSSERSKRGRWKERSVRIGARNGAGKPPIYKRKVAVEEQLRGHR